MTLLFLNGTYSDSTAHLLMVDIKKTADKNVGSFSFDQLKSLRATFQGMYHEIEAQKVPDITVRYK